MTSACAILGALLACGEGDTLAPPFDERFPPELVWELAEDAEGTAAMDALDWMRFHPVDINRATEAELIAIPHLTPTNVRAILAFRSRGESFHSVEELRTIEGGGEILYDALRPFVCVAPHRSHGLLVRELIVSRSPADAGAAGPPIELLSRVAVESPAGVEAGGVFSRRAGERTEDALITGYASLTGEGVLTRLIAGDFDVESAGGIVLWRGPSAAGVGEVKSVAARCALTPHRGNDRAHYMRGIGVSLAHPSGWEGSLFISGRSYAASVDTSGSATAYFSGAYSTAAAASKRDALRERLAGLSLEAPAAFGVRGGVTFYASRFNRTFRPSDPERLSGNSTGAFGAHAAWSEGGITARGEWGVLKGGARAFTCEAAVAAPGGETLMLRYFDFSPRFDNPHAALDGEWGETRNSRVCLALFRFGAGPVSECECRVEASEHPAPTLDCPIPRRGLQMTLIWKSALPRGGLLTCRASLSRSYECSAGVDALGRTVSAGGAASEERWILSAASPAPGGITCSERCELVRAATPDGVPHAGILLGGDIGIRLPLRTVLESRIVLFRTDGYDGRVYDREEALPGVLSAQPLYGRGARWHVRLSLRALPGYELSCRYAATLSDCAPSDAGAMPGGARQAALQLDVAL
ncbi:MAG TPA: helix-hairpin-helix domain-containing protein [Bacteroidota bacterium]|nr:helix-hairpin-helix domain-containing protein [Bacteroidota bacterium]